MKFTIILLLITLSISVCAYALNDDKDLMLYLPFDEGNGDVAMDVSGNDLEATLNGATWSKEGKIGGCVHIPDTEKFVEIDSVPELDITDEITIQAWFLPEQNQGDSNLMGRRTPNNVGGYVLQWSSQFTGSPQIETWIHIGGFQGTRNKQTIKPELNEWFHVSSTYDGNVIRQYINGDLDVEFDAPDGKITSVDIVFRIGKSQTGLAGAVGFVDEVSIYKRALTQDEVKSDMENGVFFDVSPGGKLATTWGNLKR